MRRARSVTVAVWLLGCGGDVTNLIAKLTPCADSRAYPGAGLYLADVSSASGLQLNGNASAVAGALRVTSATRNSVGSAYFSEPLELGEGASLLAHFTVRIGGGDLTTGADGMAFVLQSSEQGPAALGLDGGGLGYQNVKPSVAIELDPYENVPDPPGGHVALMLDGDIDLGLATYASPPFVLNDGVARHLWVEYRPPQLDVYMSEAALRPVSPLLSYTGLDLRASLGPVAYAGFSASAGERFNDHDLLGEAWVASTTETACAP